MLFNLPIFRKLVIVDIAILAMMLIHYLFAENTLNIITYIAILCAVGLSHAIILSLFLQNILNQLQGKLLQHLGSGSRENLNFSQLNNGVQQLLDAYQSRGAQIAELELRADQLQSEVNQLMAASDAKGSEQERYLQQAADTLNDIAGMIDQASAIVESVSDSSNAVKNDIFGCCENLAASAKATKDDAEFISSCKGQVQQLGHGVSTINNLALEINDISDQTNLLALNAAIEAARAGEQGRGFAVVADEVRNLATRARAASAKIEQSIESVVKEAEASSEAIEKISSNVDKAVIYTNAEHESMQSISDRLSGVTEQIVEVASVLEQQRAAIHDATKRL
ncbi:hypothetical protein DI392_06495 [Vibrio albus]|uniref:Methyl-accepting transducer domain-containing protein n=2 Tax=Vibrio albus TaxID=2200953 RepID=A0A2U3BAM4_9VIBR|nr:methyl-accepting chemotaxis protein [Vibrio albus]PWI33846.1 hypothetical protein DI392_06495 [Vibrio albus]